jgi:hypothetical protein
MNLQLFKIHEELITSKDTTFGGVPWTPWARLKGNRGPMDTLKMA